MSDYLVLARGSAIETGAGGHQCAHDDETVEGIRSLRG